MCHRYCPSEYIERLLFAHDRDSIYSVHTVQLVCWERRNENDNLLFLVRR